jgi:hypothetical protein
MTVPTGIHCCICLNFSGDLIQAVTIIKGYAVCDEHVDLVSRGEFDIFKLGPRKKRAV